LRRTLAWHIAVEAIHDLNAMRKANEFGIRIRGNQISRVDLFSAKHNIGLSGDHADGLLKHLDELFLAVVEIRR
jgi:hypothetical protein